MKKIIAYARLLRLPGIGALALPPVIAALTIGITDLYDISLLFLIGCYSVVYGFVLNDYADIKIDEKVQILHGKPLVSGRIKPRNALMICILLILLTYLSIFVLWRGTVIDDFKIIAILCIFLAGTLGSIYDLFGKEIPGSDFFVALSMSLIFLFGALSFGKTNELIWIIFILTFNQTLHMNSVEGGIKDADHDPKMGVKNVALLSGVKVRGINIIIPNSFKAFSIGIRLFSSVLLFTPFIFFNYSYEIWQIALLSLGIIGVLFFSFKLLTIKTFNRSQIRKYIGIQSFLRYSLVPLMLVSIVGVTVAVILIIFPIAWYIIFTPLVGEKLFKPRM